MAAQKKSVTPSELIELANADELPASWRGAVVACFDAGPQAAAELRAECDRVPEPPVADPFVSALRRISWPSDRLPGRHRKAIAAVGQAPLAFVRLVVEEARTFSWRAQSPDTLSAVVKWIVPWANKAGGTRDRLQLAGRALGYRNFVACCTLVFDEHKKLPALFRELARFVVKNEERCPMALESEGMLAIELMYLYKDLEPLHSFAELASDVAEDSDSQVLIGFMEGLLADLKGKDENLAVDNYMKALERRDADSDPWLEFFLRYSAARALINVSISRIPDLRMIVEELSSEDTALPSPWGGSPRDRLFGPYQAALEREYLVRREPALRHLEAIEPLFHEFRTPAIAMHYYWLLVECHRAFDSYRALDYCCDAVLAAEELYPPDDSRIEHMLATAALIRHAARGYISIPAERRMAVERRVEEVLQTRLDSRLAAAEARMPKKRKERPSRK